jgi:ATP-dependent Clp protease ATP-binding subunit ClpC
MVLTPRATRIVEIAFCEAKKRNENYVGTEHLFIAIYTEGQGYGYRALVEPGFAAIVDALTTSERLTGEVHG